MLNERSQKVLCAIVQTYINNPEPVGSSFITKRYSFNLSPATVRNIMADLEEQGFLSQPHTSAGRIPTDMGYRLFVNSLHSEIEYQPDNRSSLYKMVNELESIKDDINILLEETTKRLSVFSHYLSVAVSPSTRISTFNRIEFLRHRGSQVVAVLLTDEGLIKNKVLDVGSDLSQRHLNRISEYLNSEFHGYSLIEIRAKIIREMAKEKDLCDTLISRAIRICKDALFFPYDDLFIAGFAEVLGLPDFSDVEKIKEISKAIEDKHHMLQILEKISDTDGVKVIIGAENSIMQMKGFSLVASSYKEGDRPIGCVGMIGPTRMDYSRAIAVVNTTARFLSRVLTDRK